jgi:MoxR-like ATPase
MSTWPIYRGNVTPHDAIKELPPAPRWRRFRGDVLLGWTLEERSRRQDEHSRRRGETFYAREIVIAQVNAALFLRRPLLVTGNPGTGKSSLAHAIAHELKLGPVLEWPINSRSTLQDALYRYDAIARLQEASLREKSNDISLAATDIGQFLRLGPLGTALVGSEYPRVLLIDEIDKSDIDLPNDLLTIFEEGWFEIPELARLAKQNRERRVEVLIHDSDPKSDDVYVAVTDGRVQCRAFPFTVITSNGERALPPAFLRRCIQLRLPDPGRPDLERIVSKHFNPTQPDSEMAAFEDTVSLDQIEEVIEILINRYEDDQSKGGLIATDQLLNAIYLAHSGVDILQNEQLLKTVFEHLSRSMRR